MPEFTSRTVAARVSAWRSRLRVYIQGEEDYACGLYCFATAAAHLKTIVATRASSPLEQVLARIADGPKLFEQRARPTHGPRPSASPTHHAELYTKGLWHSDVPIVAMACGLKATSTTDILHAIGADSPLLSFLAVTPPAHPREHDPQPFTHYVLALEYVPGERGDLGSIVLADPHPWRPLSDPQSVGHRSQVYAVPTETFLRAWEDISEWKKIGNRAAREWRSKAWSLSALAEQPPIGE